MNICQASLKTFMMLLVLPSTKPKTMETVGLYSDTDLFALRHVPNVMFVKIFRGS